LQQVLCVADTITGCYLVPSIESIENV